MARRRRMRPVVARRKDMRDYNRAMKKLYLDPMYQALWVKFGTDLTENEIKDNIFRVTAGVQVNPKEIEKNLRRMKDNHEKRFINTFKYSIGIDISGILQDATVNNFMRQKIAENVDLIKTIPPRFQAGLTKRINDLTFDGETFNQYNLHRALKEEYRVSGYNVRRITRDQTSKMTGQLNQIRQQELGITNYQWLTSADDRVRSTHQANNGKYFRWDNPPPETGHPGQAIQCRCTAIAVVTKEDQEKLAGMV